jgi:hypothetical protein
MGQEVQEEKMGPIVCPQTAVQDYHSTLRNIPEQRRYHLHRGGSLKSRIIPLTKKSVHFKVAITEMYPRMPWQLVADPLGSAEHTLVTSGLDQFRVSESCENLLLDCHILFK